MTTIENILMIDGVPVSFEPGQSVLEAALANGIFIPHLCWHPDFGAHGSCKLCTVIVNGRNGSACTIKAMPGQEVFSNTPELGERRRTLLQMLFVEGNHFCPGCEKSGDCKLQAHAYEEEMLNPHFNQFYPNRPLDGSHPDILLDLNRCIMCELCVRASRDLEPCRQAVEETRYDRARLEADDGVDRPHHAQVRLVGRALRHDAFVCRRNVRVRAHDDAHPAVEVDAEGVLLAGELAVEIDEAAHLGAET